MIREFSLIAVLLWSLPVWAQAQEERLPWSQLTPTDQQYLQRFSEKWDQMPRQRQERLLNGVNKWKNMTPEERREAKERFQRFRNLPPEQQKSLREARRWFKSLPPGAAAAIEREVEEHDSGRTSGLQERISPLIDRTGSFWTARRSVGSLTAPTLSDKGSDPYRVGFC